jgi:hypothetical protein
MSKIAGIKGQSPEAYSTPPGKTGIRTFTNPNNEAPVPIGPTPPVSLLFNGPLSIDVIGGEKAIIMFTGNLLDPNAEEVATSCNVNVGIYVDEKLVYSINPLLPFIDTTFTQSFLPVSLFFETKTDELTAGLHTFDVKAFVSIPNVGAGCEGQNARTIVILTSV